MPCATARKMPMSSARRHASLPRRRTLRSPVSPPRAPSTTPIPTKPKTSYCAPLESRRSLRDRIARHSSLGFAAPELHADGFADRERTGILHDRPIRTGDNAVSTLQHRLGTQVQEALFERADALRERGNAFTCGAPPALASFGDSRALSRRSSEQPGEIPAR